MNEATLKATGAGAILCDASIAAQVGEDWFDPAYWRTAAVAGGRGAAWRVQTPAGEAVLRHFRRGGSIARVLGDLYVWAGAEKTRPFREFRLLQRLQALGLPVPQPLAARYRRERLLFYRADLLTRLIPAATTLAEGLAERRIDAAAMRRVGATIARFHAAGAYHADLNAHNVLFAGATAEAPAGGAVHLIDFDRGELRADRRGWPQENLQRLHRSLRKIGAAADGEARFERELWQPLQDAYTAARQQSDNGAPPRQDRNA
ncbi:3-deoxy-D-manno-octulosonic acid kinase [Tahibacter caeni]|uniref:3-deoxy-D-manno-octulosonic acid kinase n=1 Tax=Tahibacter caeni TaxID=1453545 RepID=UPI0021483119|nr:3-deoxy-D-manno-octulosonic acid kinase [Tahibacter caeni]